MSLQDPKGPSALLLGREHQLLLLAALQFAAAPSALHFPLVLGSAAGDCSHGHSSSPLWLHAVLISDLLLCSPDVPKQLPNMKGMLVCSSLCKSNMFTLLLTKLVLPNYI